MNPLNLVEGVKVDDEDGVDNEPMTYREDFVISKLDRDYWDWVEDSDFSNRDIEDKIRSLSDD